MRLARSSRAASGAAIETSITAGATSGAGLPGATDLDVKGLPLRGELALSHHENAAHLRSICASATRAAAFVRAAGAARSAHCAYAKLAHAVRDRVALLAAGVREPVMSALTDRRADTGRRRRYRHGHRRHQRRQQQRQPVRASAVSRAHVFSHPIALAELGLGAHPCCAVKTAPGVTACLNTVARTAMRAQPATARRQVWCIANSRAADPPT